jgi:hypothetical protein
MSRRALALSPVALLFAVASCATVKKAFTPPFARLDGAVVNDRYAVQPRENLRVVRAGAVVTPSVGMPLLKGDSITTSRIARAVVNFRDGYEVTLDTSTTIYIENPSIFLRIGQAFIRTLLGTRGTPPSEKFETHTPQGTLHGRGTEYLVSVGPEGTDVTVASGVVDATSPDGRWPGVTYMTRQQGRIDPQRGPLRMQSLSDGQLEFRLAWVRAVEALTKVVVPPVRSMTESAARRTLERAGLSVAFGASSRETDEAPPGQVVDQFPAPGVTVRRGSVVSLTVAKALPPERCTVPKISGQTEAVALRRLADARLRGERTHLDRGAEYVTTQTPAPDSKVDCNSVVRYTMDIRVQ